MYNRHATSCPIHNASGSHKPRAAYQRLFIDTASRVNSAMHVPQGTRYLFTTLSGIVIMKMSFQRTGLLALAHCISGLVVIAPCFGC